MFAAAQLARRTAIGTVDQRHYGYINDALPTGSRVSRSGLVLALNMRTLAGSKLRDFSGAGNSAAITGATYADGVTRNGAYNFVAASSQKLTVANAASLQIGDSMTVAAIVRPASLISGQGIVEKCSTGVGFILKVTSNGKFYLTGSGIPNTFSTAAMAASSKYLVAATIQKLNDTQSQLAYYINGAQDTNTTVTAVLKAETTRGLTIGDDAFSSVYYDGAIGPVLVWNNARSAAEMATLYQDLTAGGAF